MDKPNFIHGKYIIALIVIIIAAAIITQFHRPVKYDTLALPRAVPAIRQPDAYQQNLDALLSIVRKQDPHAALQELQRRMDTDPLVFKNCHAMAHEIGHEGFKKYKDFTTALSYQDITCSDGYLHGVLEQAFADQAGDITTLFAKVQAVCSNLKHQAGRCYHGVGHALMFYTENNLPQSLALCEKYTGTPRGRCYEGVFMENFLSDPDLHPSQFVDPKNPFFPCPQEKNTYKQYCYFYAPIYFLQQHDNDYAQALTWCETETHGYAAACAKGVGSLIVKYRIQDPLFGQALCAASPHMPACISGMVSYGFTFYGNAKQVMADMCGKMDAPYRHVCLSNIHTFIRYF